MMLKPGLLPHLIFPHLVGHFDPRLALVLGGAVFSGAQVGARLGVKIDKKKHKKYFGYLLVFIACWMVYMSFKGG